MTLADFIIRDHPAFDMARGTAAVVGAVLFLTCAVFLVLLTTPHRRRVVPSWVQLALLGWLVGDAYVAARETFEIGRPVFIFGLPLALAWEGFALAYLRRLWSATHRLRFRPDW